MKLKSFSNLVIVKFLNFTSKFTIPPLCVKNNQRKFSVESQQIQSRKDSCQRVLVTKLVQRIDIKTVCFSTMGTNLGGKWGFPIARTKRQTLGVWDSYVPQQGVFHYKEVEGRTQIYVLYGFCTCMARAPLRTHIVFVKVVYDSSQIYVRFGSVWQCYVLFRAHTRSLRHQ